MNWDDVRIFVTLVRAESLSVAARMLRVEHSTVARRIDGLEKALGLRLFDRLPRGWQLTAEGEQLFVRAEQMEEKANEFLREAADGGRLSGAVRVSAPPTLSSAFLAPKFASVQEKWFPITLELVGETRVASLNRREADLALRLGRPQDPGLAARRLGTMSYGLFAHHSYLERHPPQNWRFIGYDDSLHHAPEQQWLEKFAAGRAFAFRSNTLSSLCEAARHGLGVAALPHFLASTIPDLAELTVEPMEARELWLVIHPDVRRSPRVRLIADIVADIVASSEQELFRTAI
ncbi:LysR family transcriptional regulator [Noviherbaspirillum massiliense]|uniref:LysR family transcriptional regulator n=1 Tax=Noviherbaspirillum massiliense TaxID=1465823 RepID=UPI0002F0E723|nr:LysR family transcriptional regulator [Noviherbaspirillum massiliense]